MKSIQIILLLLALTLVKCESQQRYLRRPGDTTDVGSYGSSSSSYGSSSYGSSSYGGRGSISSSSYSTPSYSNSYDSYPSSTQRTYGKSSHYNNYRDSFKAHADALHIPITWTILLNFFTFCIAMLITAHQFEYYPEGNFANFCRLCINTLDCIFKLMYNLYHCRLNEIPTVVCAEDDDDEYTEQELQTMKLRPGIGRALEVEHHKAMKKTSQQVNTAKAVRSKQNRKKSSNNVLS